MSLRSSRFTRAPRQPLSSSKSFPNRIYAGLTALASALGPSRVGTASPLSAGPLLGSPGGSVRDARATSASRLRVSLRASSTEGAIAELVGACTGGAILTAWALYLNASTLLTGILLSLAQLAQLFQFPAAWTTAWLGHRRACITLVTLARFSMLPLVALPFLPTTLAAKQTILVLVSALSAVLGVLGNNAWVSWMSDLVPRRVRGRYFGRRTALCTMSNALGAGLVALLMDSAKASQRSGEALALLHVLGIACGALCTYLMFQQHDPGGEPIAVSRDLKHMLKPLRDPQVRGLLKYIVVWNGAVGVAGSFFTLHMLKNLKMSFTLVAIHGTAAALVKTLAAPFWGPLLDRFGARPVLISCSFGICTVPFIWLFPSADFLWPLLLDVLVAGVLWSGHGLAIFNLPLSITPRQERPFYLAAFATLTGLTFSLATLAGGLLSEALPDTFSMLGHTFHDLQVLFVVSGLLRVGGALCSLSIREPSARQLTALWSTVGQRFAVTRLGMSRWKPANDNLPTSKPQREDAA